MMSVSGQEGRKGGGGTGRQVAATDRRQRGRLKTMRSDARPGGLSLSWCVSLLFRFVWRIWKIGR